MSCAPPPPWYEELAALAVEPKLLVSVPAERIAELERRVVADSHNCSSPPPSSGGGPAWAKAVIDLLIEAADAVADALAAGQDAHAPGAPPGFQGRCRQEALCRAACRPAPRQRGRSPRREPWPDGRETAPGCTGGT
ncbi:hypothetical protein AB0B92_39510 [Streptomyces hygroscopicus]|uniref:hypothetical protein n=1 Tax=Streptomyces hygroscopicus TaxID=1912 RepID=UPI0033E807D5